MEKIYYQAEVVTIVSNKRWFHSGLYCSGPTSKLDYYVCKKSKSNYGYTFINEIDDRDVKKELDKKNIMDYVVENKIIFELVEDKNGKRFAKEIMAGIIIPIIDSSDYIIEYKDIEMIIRARSKDDKEKYYAYDYEFAARPIYQFTNPTLKKVKNVILKKEYRIATKKDIDEYKKDFKKKKGLFTVKNKDYYQEMKQLEDENVYTEKKFSEYQEKEEIIEQKPREQFNKATIIMENIELLLIQVSKIDISKKQELEIKYKELLDSENKELTLSPLTLESLKSLEAELEFIIQFQKKKDDDIISCLDTMINEYNNELTSRTIEDIDKLSELFLKMKNTYSLTTQRKITEKLANLYILEIYENKNTININDLKNSYFNDILKSIIIYITGMIDNDVIENNIIIDYDNITPSYVLELIKQIKFKNKDKNKQKHLTSPQNN